jgi:DNA polymerase III subunit delta'
MGFSEILGHQRQTETLQLALAKGRLHHAYLFAGPEGVGKRTLALALAKAIHCAERVDDFCGQCANCARIEDGNHPDVRTIEPLAGKKEISIQQIREIEKQLNFRSFSGRKKIAVLDPATLMNLSAQNALLKTLEEPPQDSLLVLVATNTGGLLPTLRSRCLHLSFGSLQCAQLANYLASKKGLKREEADFLAAMAMGSLGTALKIDGEEMQEKRRVWIELLSSLKAGDYRAATVTAEGLAKDRDESLKFLEWAGSWYRDLMVHAVTRGSAELVNRDVLARMEHESADDRLEHSLSLIAQTIEAAAGIQRNLNRRMVLENLLFNVVGNR